MSKVEDVCCLPGSSLISSTEAENLMIGSAILKYYRAKWGKHLSLKAITTRVLKEQIAKNGKIL